jgi:UDPglucose 6-dehydrogenase
MKVGIIGLGWVGKSMKDLFPAALVHDPAYGGSVTKTDINGCDVAFVCVPTPWIGEKLDTLTVEDYPFNR